MVNGEWGRALNTKGTKEHEEKHLWVKEQRAEGRRQKAEGKRRKE